MNNGADINKVTYYSTIIYWGAEIGNIDMVHILSGADVNKGHIEGESPLHMSIRCGDKDIVWLLLENEANINAINLDGQSPLH